MGARWERDGEGKEGDGREMGMGWQLGMGEEWERDGKGMTDGCEKDGRREILERNWRRVEEG